MLFRYELRRFRGLLPVVALVFVLLVPTIYGALYLSANWDPYGRMSSLPVAIVNEDRPVEVDGRTLDTGADVTRQLVDQHAFDWHETSRQDAEAGLREGRYYLALEIPSDLSADLASASGDDPRQAQITLRRDDANGFVIGSVTASSQSRIENAVDTAAVEAYFKAVFQNLGTLRAGMVDAEDGAARLADGAAQLDDGATRLQDGVAQAHEGAGRLASGAADAQDGAGRLADGAGRLQQGAAQLQDGTASAKDGASQLDAGIGQARAGSQQLASGAREIDANVPALRDGASSLSDGLTRLETGSADLADGAHQVADGTQELYDTVVPGLDAVIARQDQVASDVAAVNADVQDLNAVVDEAGAATTKGIDDASAQLAALAEADPAVEDTPQYAALQEALATARASTGTAVGRADEVAQTSAGVDERVRGFVSEDVAGGAKDKITRLNDGAHQVADGADTLHGGIGQAQDGAASLADGVGRFSDGLDRLATGADSLDDGLARLQDGSGQLVAGLDRLDSGAGELADGAGSLQQGAQQLDEGLGTLSDGATSLDDGLAQLETGSGDLTDGTARLTDGAAQLRDGLADGVKKVPALSQDAADRASSVMSHPVQVAMDVQNPAGVYGRGLAPLFFSIALWVFGIAAFNVMRPVSGRLLAGRRQPLLLAISAWLPVGVLAVAGGLLMLAATVPLGIAPVHPVHAVVLVVLVAVVFSVFAHLLQTALGTPGSALLLVTLILQLASAGGTYPAAVLPGFFRWISPAMPMSHSIEAFRYAVSGGLPSQYWGGVAFLAVFGAAALLLDMAVVRGRQRFRMQDLHPALER